jgi:hypothetical protein
MPTSPDSILEAHLTKKYTSVPRGMTPPVLRILLNGKQAYVTLDTGAAISVMNEATFKEYFPTDSLESTTVPALKILIIRSFLQDNCQHLQWWTTLPLRFVCKFLS